VCPDLTDIDPTEWVFHINKSSTQMNFCRLQEYKEQLILIDVAIACMSSKLLSVPFLQIIIFPS